MNGDKRTSLIVLVIAVLSIILAGVFEPRVGVQARESGQPTSTMEDVSNWLFRFAAWLPEEEAPLHPDCPAGPHGASGHGLL